VICRKARVLKLAVSSGGERRLTYTFSLIVY
jgi:hypothetical protein